MYGVTQSWGPHGEEGEVFSLVGQNKSLICLIWGIWTVPGEDIIFRGKKGKSFLYASWDHGNFECQEFTTVSGNSVCSHLKRWSVKREEVGHFCGGGGGFPYFMPVAPACRIFVTHFKVDIIVPFVRITKLTAVLLQENTEENLTLWTQSAPNKKNDYVCECSTWPVHFSLFWKVLCAKPRTCLSGEG